jgi:demethylmenaquinone methyltransferase / 2-methoxy-6-polyprenyl-1,4-benzoquinol methylase
VIGQEGDHGRKVERLFSRIALWYDFLNHFLSLGVDIYWRRRLVRLVRGEGRLVVLDLAAGTMDVSRELHRIHPEARIVAADFCLPMLRRGKRKISPMEPVHAVCADGLRLPFPDQTFDAVTIAFGIRNIRPRSGAFEEIRRVLKPGGRLCILEFGTAGRPVLKGFYNVYLRVVLPLVGRLVSRDKDAYRYLAETIAAFPGEEALGNELVAAGFEQVYYLPLTAGIVFIHVGLKGAGATPLSQTAEEDRRAAGRDL